MIHVSKSGTVCMPTHPHPRSALGASDARARIYVCVCYVCMYGSGTSPASGPGHSWVCVSFAIVMGDAQVLVVRRCMHAYPGGAQNCRIRMVLQLGYGWGEHF